MNFLKQKRELTLLNWTWEFKGIYPLNANPAEILYGINDAL